MRSPSVVVGAKGSPAGARAALELHRLLGGILSCGTDNGTDALDGGTLRVVKEVCVLTAGGVEISRTIGGAARCQTTVGAYNTRTDGDRSGPQLLRAGAAIDEEADEAELAARGAGTSLTGKLRVAAAVTSTRIHLMPRLPEFLQRHPDLEIEVVLDDRNVDLVQESIDIALRMGQLIDSSLTAQHIASAPHVVVGTPKYFARASEPTMPSSLTALSRHAAC